MRRLERFKVLQLFGDGKPHNWFETIFLGVQYLKVHQNEFERLFRRTVENNLVRRVYKASSYKDDYYILAERGEQCFREEQIERGGDYSYYKNYDRSVHGKYGVDHFAPLPKNLVPTYNPED